jgi:serine/threonine-protein kinase
MPQAAGAPRNVIPPSPTIPRAVAQPRTTPAMGVPRPIPAISRPAPASPRTTPAMGVPAMGVPRAAPAQSMPRVMPGASATRPGVGSPSAGLTGRVIGDRYGVTGLIGEGGMGVVYEAEHLAIGKLVAVKVLHPEKAQNREAVSRLRHEARVAGTLGHPNICAIYDMGRLDDGSPYLVMERLHGESLAQRIAREGAIVASDMLDIMLQVLSALAAAHQQGVVHRDLKPDNIFLSRREGMRPVPKLLDFGISKAENVEDTVVGDPAGALMAAGTPYYMAPEQARGERHLDWRVDLWSAGVVLYEGLTGQRPFVAKNYNALLVQILSMQQLSVRDVKREVPVVLSRIVDRAMSKRAEDRFQSAIELQSALRSALEEEEPAPRTTLPLLINEQTTDDTDATTVFSRVAFGRPPMPSEEDATPIYSPTDLIDDERTVVETPAFLNEAIAALRAPGKKP